MQYSNLCFTCNNYTPEQYAYLRDLDIFKYLIMGKEIGESGTPHLQGYAVLKKRTLVTKLRKLLPGCHLEKRKGSHHQASEYCKKDSDFIEIGTPPVQGKRTDLEEVAEKIREGVDTTLIASDHPTTYIKFYRGIEQLALKLQTSYDHDCIRGIWIWGPPGSGKSHAARFFDPQAFIKPQNKWWDGYAGQKTVILDDLDTSLLGHYLKIWADRWSATGETKGGTVHLRHHLFVVTSNYPPSHFWSDDVSMLAAISRRFSVYHKEEKEEKINFVPGTPTDPNLGPVREFSFPVTYDDWDDDQKDAFYHETGMRK